MSTYETTIKIAGPFSSSDPLDKLVSFFEANGYSVTDKTREKIDFEIPLKSKGTALKLATEPPDAELALVDEDEVESKEDEDPSDVETNTIEDKQAVETEDGNDVDPESKESEESEDETDEPEAADEADESKDDVESEDNEDAEVGESEDGGESETDAAQDDEPEDDDESEADEAEDGDEPIDDGESEADEPEDDGESEDEETAEGESDGDAKGESEDDDSTKDQEDPEAEPQPAEPAEVCTRITLTRGQKGASYWTSNMTELLASLTLTVSAEGILLSYEVETTLQRFTDDDIAFWRKEGKHATSFITGKVDAAIDWRENEAHRVDQIQSDIVIIGVQLGVASIFVVFVIYMFFFA